MGDTHPPECGVEVCLGDSLILQSCQHPIRELLLTGQTDYLGRLIVKSAGEEEDLKILGGEQACRPHAGRSMSEKVSMSIANKLMGASRSGDERAAKSQKRKIDCPKE